MNKKNIILKELIDTSYKLFNEYNSDEHEIIYILIEFLFKIEKKDTFLNYNLTLDNKLVKKYFKYLKKVLVKNYPVQYITKKQFFYKYDFIINKKVLIPRFDTEHIIEIANQYIKKGDVLEIGSGSGIIGICLKLENPSLNIDQVDISRYALKNTKINNKLHNTNNNVFRSNLFKKINKKYDLIISNPPYLDISDYVSKNTKYEPKLALYAQNKGFEIIEKIILNFDKFLKEDGILLLETNTYHLDMIKNILDVKYSIKNFKDYKNNQRFILIRKNL